MTLRASTATLGEQASEPRSRPRFRGYLPVFGTVSLAFGLVFVACVLSGPHGSAARITGGTLALVTATGLLIGAIAWLLGRLTRRRRVALLTYGAIHAIFAGLLVMGSIDAHRHRIQGQIDDEQAADRAHGAESRFLSAWHLARHRSVSRLSLEELSELVTSAGVVAACPDHVKPDNRRAASAIITAVRPLDRASQDYFDAWNELKAKGGVMVASYASPEDIDDRITIADAAAKAAGRFNKALEEAPALFRTELEGSAFEPDKIDRMAAELFSPQAVQRSRKTMADLQQMYSLHVTLAVILRDHWGEWEVTGDAENGTLVFSEDADLELQQARVLLARIGESARAMREDIRLDEPPESGGGNDDTAPTEPAVDTPK